MPYDIRKSLKQSDTVFNRNKQTRQITGERTGRGEEPGLLFEEPPSRLDIDNRRQDLRNKRGIQNRLTRESLADADVKVKEVKNAKPADPERKGRPETLPRRDQGVPGVPKRQPDSGVVEGEGAEGVQPAQEVDRQAYP